jgi:hypothetical protein
MTKRCSVVGNYIEDSESPGAEAQFRSQGFMSGLKALTPKRKIQQYCVDQGFGAGGFADSPGTMASSFALRAASSATCA